jgi:hypothetical protein
VLPPPDGSAAGNWERLPPALAHSRWKCSYGQACAVTVAVRHQCRVGRDTLSTSSKAAAGRVPDRLIRIENGAGVTIGTV